MKVTAALLTAAVTVAASSPHRHNHQHLHKKDATETAVVPGPTIIAYVLNGEPISAEEVQQGIANGTLVFIHGAPQIAASYSAAPSSSSSSSSSPAWSAPPDTSSTAPPAYSSPAAPQPSQSYGGGVDTPFPDGEIDCSDFPSDYGAVPLNYLGLGGWSGVQSPGSASGGFSDIMTLTSSQCSNGNCCVEGAYCSYACPPGYQKAQWPSTQGATGQSVGGIQCSGGKLQLTNSGLSNTLCIPGASEVTVQIQNTLGQNVAVCRTDYPGTESETIPVNAGPGQTQPLACPNADSYYMWQGSHTSAQYYVNPAGVSQEDGCQWGSSANPWGNYAPLNLGVGYSNGAAWLSIFQNAPTTDAKLDFSVEIQGDGISGTCRYSNGQYCGGANYDDCSSTTGCTVSRLHILPFDTN